jgi:hypothetical protein
MNYLMLLNLAREVNAGLPNAREEQNKARWTSFRLPGNAGQHYRLFVHRDAFAAADGQLFHVQVNLSPLEVPPWKQLFGEHAVVPSANLYAHHGLAHAPGYRYCVRFPDNVATDAVRDLFRHTLTADYG